MTEHVVDLFLAAVRAFAAGDAAAGAEHAERAAGLDPASRVYREGAAYLRRVAHEGASSVYVSGEAFGAFIRGGGNVGLYQAVSAALREVYGQYSRLSVLDIGVGDGMALLPALTPNVAALQLVEPSDAMLGRALAALAARGVAADAFHGTVQEFLAREETARYDVAQATFSLQSLPRAERLDVLRGLRQRVDRLLIAEFDAPAACDQPLSEGCVRAVAARYERGLAEYEGDGGVVAQGFLMPVMFGLFDPGAERTNYEQPIERWVTDLRDAGFADVRARELFRYWWAPAFLLDAR